VGAAVPEKGGGMSDRANHFKIGIFVLTGLGLFVVALFVLGIGSYFVKTDVFETYIDGGVENLAVGALVKLRGVTIGKVTAIRFIASEQPQYKEQSVLILFEVPRDAGVIIPTDNVQQMLDAEAARGLRAKVEGQGFLGPSIVLLEYLDPKLYPVMPLPWTPKHYYIPSAPSRFDHVFSSLEKTLSRTEDLDFSALLNRTQKLIETANRTVENINRIDFDHLGTNASSFVVELRETNRGLQRTLAEAQDAIRGADLTAVSRDAQALETRLSSAAIELRRVLASVDTGELNTSLANVRSATEELTVLLHNLEQRASSVLFSKPPKPASSVEQPPKK
jgi:phospholipid/cholesterol/gamma-HCH transport system substrate-binding protein